MTRAFSIRMDPELLSRAKLRAMEAGVSFTAWVAETIETRLEAPSLLEQPMIADTNVPRGAVCAHPFRDEGRCRSCGEQR